MPLSKLRILPDAPDFDEAAGLTYDQAPGDEIFVDKLPIQPYPMLKAVRQPVVYCRLVVITQRAVKHGNTLYE